MSQAVKVPLTRNLFGIFWFISVFRIRNNRPWHQASYFWPFFWALKLRFGGQKVFPLACSQNTHLSGISIYYFPKDVAVCLRWTRFDGWHWGDFFILNPTTCSFHRISKTGLHLCKYNKIIYVHCAWINEYRSFPGSYEHFLISSGNKAWLKQSPTGFEPMTSVIPV